MNKKISEREYFDSILDRSEKGLYIDAHAVMDCLRRASIEVKVEYSRTFYLNCDKVRSLLERDMELQLEIANYRGIIVEGLNNNKD